MSIKYIDSITGEVIGEYGRGPIMVVVTPEEFKKRCEMYKDQKIIIPKDSGKRQVREIMQELESILCKKEGIDGKNEYNGGSGGTEDTRCPDN